MSTVNIPEELLELAREVRIPREQLVIPTQGSTLGEHQFRRIALALELAGKPPVFRLRAMVEEWDVERLVRELY